MNGRHYADWLRTQFIIHKGDKTKSKAALARALSVEPSAISKILNYTRQIKAHEHVIMRQFFGFPIDGEHAVQHISQPLPPNSHNGRLSDSQDPSEAEWAIPKEINNNPATMALNSIQSMVVTDHYMEPDFVRDDVIVVDINDRTPEPAGVFVVSDKFTSMIRHCELLDDSKLGDVKITALNKDFQPQILKLDDFEIVGRVIGKVQWAK